MSYLPPQVKTPAPRLDREVVHNLNIALAVIWGTVGLPFASWVHDRPSRVSSGGDRAEGLPTTAVMWLSVLGPWFLGPVLLQMIAPHLVLACQVGAAIFAILLCRRLLARRGLPMYFLGADGLWSTLRARRAPLSWIWWSLAVLVVVQFSLIFTAGWDWVPTLGWMRMTVLATAVWGIVAGITVAGVLRAVIEPPIRRRAGVEQAMRTVLRIAPADPIFLTVQADGKILADLPHHAAVAPESVARNAANLFPEYRITRLDERALELTPFTPAELAARAAEAASLQASGGLIAGDESPVQPDAQQQQQPGPGAAPWAIYQG